MRETVIYCDKCQKQIIGDPLKVFFEQVDAKTGDWSKEILYPDIRTLDFCGACIQDISEFITDSKPEKMIKPNSSEAMAMEILDKRVKKTWEPFDMEKALAMKEQGWTSKEIGEALNCTEAKVNNQFFHYRKKQQKLNSIIELQKGTSNTVMTNADIPKKQDPAPERKPAVIGKSEAEKKRTFDIGKIMALVKAGWTDKQIAEEFHTDEETIKKLTCIHRFKLEKKK